MRNRSFCACHITLTWKYWWSLFEWCQWESFLSAWCKIQLFKLLVEVLSSINTILSLNQCQTSYSAYFGNNSLYQLCHKCACVLQTICRKSMEICTAKNQVLTIWNTCPGSIRIESPLLLNEWFWKMENVYFLLMIMKQTSNKLFKALFFFYHGEVLLITDVQSSLAQIYGLCCFNGLQTLGCNCNTLPRDSMH